MDAYRAHLMDLIRENGIQGRGSGARGGDSVHSQATSDPLAALNGAVGLVADSIQTLNDIDDFNTSPKGDTAALEHTRCTLQSFKSTIQVFYKTLRHVEKGHIKCPGRRAMVKLETLIAVLTEAILTMSEIGTVLVDMSVEAVSLGIECPELICPRYGKPLKRLGTRLQEAESLLSRILSVLRVGEQEAVGHATQLQERVLGLMRSNPLLLDRLKRLRDTFEENSLLLQDRSVGPAPRSWRLTDALEEPPVYSTRPVDNRGSDLSIGSTDSRSIFSGLTLADLTALSLIPLPVNSAEVKYGMFYSFAYCRSVSDELDKVCETQAKQKTQAIEKALGFREPTADKTNERLSRQIQTRYKTGTQASHAAVQPRISGLRVGAYADQVWRDVCEAARPQRS